MTIRRKLLASYGAVVVFVLALLSAVFYKTEQVDSGFHELIYQALPAVEKLEDLRFRALQIVEATSAVVLLAEYGSGEAVEEFGAKERLQLEEAKVGLVRAAAAYATLVDEHFPREIGDKDATLAAGQALLEASDAVIAALAGGRPAVDLATLGKLKESERAFLEAIEHSLRDRAAELVEAQTQLDEGLHGFLLLVVVLAALAVGVVGIASHVTAHRIATPIRALRDAAVRIGKGEFAALDVKAGRDEIGDLVGAFRQMAEDLRGAMGKLSRQERLATIGQVTATVSHELRNPLGTIRNSMFTIRERIAGKVPGVERALDRVERNIARCDDIIGDLLDFSRIREIKREPTSIDRWLGEVLDDQSVPAGVTLRRDLRSGARLSVDRNRLRRVLINLLDNAFQALADESGPAESVRPAEVAVEARTGSGRLEIAVNDTGPGISPELLPKIFEPLFSTKSFWVGLGLPTVKQIIEQHGGGIEVESAPGRGTRMTLWLPLEQALAEAAE
jgi:signal transduction histidine kinase